MHPFPNALALAALISLPLASCSYESEANEQGESLTLTFKSDQVIAPGQKDEVLVTIARTDWSGEVQIDFEDLPAGITVVDPGPIAADDLTRTYTLEASESIAPDREYQIVVKASGGGLEVRETFELEVRERL